MAIFPVLLTLDSYNTIRAAGEARLADEQHNDLAKKAARIPEWEAARMAAVNGRASEPTG